LGYFSGLEGKSKVAMAHPTAVEMRDIVIKINGSGGG